MAYNPRKKLSNRIPAPVVLDRVQTTVSVSGEAVAALDRIADESGVSRSRLFDLAVRRLVRWAEVVRPADIRLIVDYEVTEKTSGFIRKFQEAPKAPVTEPAIPVEPEIKEEKLSEEPKPGLAKGRYRIYKDRL